MQGFHFFRRSVGFFRRAFLVFLMKGSKKRGRKQPGKLMAKSRSQPVNLPGAWLLMKPLSMITFDATWLHQWHVTPDSPKRKQNSSNKVWIPNVTWRVYSNSSVPSPLSRGHLTPPPPTFPRSSIFSFKGMSLSLLFLVQEDSF